jgi:hypothetical protein
VIKFEKIKPGMVLLDIRRERAGNTTMTRLGKWTVKIVSVDEATRSAHVIWNGNREGRWSEGRLRKLYIKEPPSYTNRRKFS